MISKELRNKSISELNEIINGHKLEMVSNSKNIVNGSEKNVKKNLFLRKSIARIKTIVNEKKLIEAIEQDNNE